MAVTMAVQRAHCWAEHLVAWLAKKMDGLTVVHWAAPKADL